MNTPVSRALEIIDENGDAVWKADTEETIEEGDPSGEYAHAVGAWHGLSKGGEAIVSFSALNHPWGAT
jgi:N-acetylated-alpha-linked acidic dipeptidase